MKIGVFGGTFNPPHNGHVRLVTDFADRLSLDKVFIIPCKRPVHKTWEDLIMDEMRYDMCRLAFTDKRFEVSRIEIDRYSDSFTVYTLMQLKEQYPDAEFYLIIGSDMFLMFHKWYKHKEIMENCTVCVASRSDSESIYALRSYAFKQFHIYIKELEADGIVISPMEPYEISSTELRTMLKEGKDVSQFVPEKVMGYIKKRGLYGHPKE